MQIKAKVLDAWLDRREFFEIELAKAADSARKYELRKLIDDCNHEITRINDPAYNYHKSQEDSNNDLNYSLEKALKIHDQYKNFDVILKARSLLDLLYKKRRIIEDWKRLHENFQNISLKIVTVRGLVVTEDYDILLHDLEFHWRNECSFEIMRCTDRKRIIYIHEVSVELDEVEINSNWFKKLQLYTTKINENIDFCSDSHDLILRIDLIKSYLSSIEKVNSQLLTYLDDMLKNAIIEIESDFQEFGSILRSSD